MDTDQGDVVDDCLRAAAAAGGEVDRISGLPDELLHEILLRLPSTADAARTGVLSRRWRRVWAHLPDLSFRHHDGDRVGDALAAYSAATLRRLHITALLGRVTVGHVSSWLRFASRRLAGDLRLSLERYGPKKKNGDEDVVLLPLCERVASISLDLYDSALRFRMPRAGAGEFKALATMRIVDARVNRRALEDILSSRCPRLKELTLKWITLTGRADTLSISSDSIERLEISMQFHGRLRVATPMLQVLRFCGVQCDFFIAAPKLSELCWGDGEYDPSRQNITGPGHYLRRLQIERCSSGSMLMQRFNTVHELDLTVHITEGIQEYRRFLEDTDKLVKCEVLVVSVEKNKHALRSTMVHLLRKCSGIRKLVVQLSSSRNNYQWEDDDFPCKWLSGCPCSLLESRKADNIVLDLLEEVEIKGQADADHKVVLLRILCNHSIMFQKRVVITVLEESRVEYIGRKVCSILPPNRNVEVTLRSTGVTKDCSE